MFTIPYIQNDIRLFFHLKFPLLFYNTLFLYFKQYLDYDRMMLELFFSVASDTCKVIQHVGSFIPSHYPISAPLSSISFHSLYQKFFVDIYGSKNTSILISALDGLFQLFLISSTINEFKRSDEVYHCQNYRAFVYTQSKPMPKAEWCRYPLKE